jgi:hypothetical protein
MNMENSRAGRRWNDMILDLWRELYKSWDITYEEFLKTYFHLYYWNTLKTNQK